MKYLLFFLFSLFLILQNNLLIAQNLQLLIKKVDPSVVKIYTIDQKNEYASQGSGVIISNSGICISNYHVLMGAKKAIVITASGKKFDVSKIIDYSKENDLIKFKIDLKGEITTPAIVNDVLPEKGANVFAVGYPNGFLMQGESTLTPGIISGFREVNGLKLIQTNAPFTHGSSGGGLFDSSGKFIGITSGTYASDIKDRHANMNKVIPTYLLKKLTRNMDISLVDFYESLKNNETYIKGMIAYEGFELETAIQLFSLHLEDFPEDATAWFRLGKSYSILGGKQMNNEYLNNALDCLNNAIILDSNYYYAWGEAALTLTVKGSFELADLFAEEAYRLQPNVSFTNYVVGRVANGSKNYSKAVKYFSNAIQLASEFDKSFLLHQWYLERAIANGWLKQDYSAEQDYKNCLLLNSQNLDALWSFGNFLAIRKRISESCIQFNKLKQLSPKYNRSGTSVDEMIQYNKCY
jgi:tetratricopeptide (TPR) repeat protein